MAILTVFKFAAAEGAEQALANLMRMQPLHAIPILDAAVVSWPKGRNRPRTRQAMPPLASDILDGAFWGMLFGVIFFLPVLAAPAGNVMGAFSSALADVGIDENFIYDVRSKITEGNSALFVLSSHAVIDRLFETRSETKPELIATHLPKDQEAKLRDLFAQSDKHPEIRS